MNLFRSLFYFMWLVALVGMTNCSAENPAKSNLDGVTPADLIDFNQKKVRRQHVFIDSLVASMHSPDFPYYVETTTGLRVWSSEAFLARSPLNPGDIVQWVGELMLMDSSLVHAWTEEESLRFRWNQSDWPAGFHELATLLASEQQAMCIIPSHIAWGLTGFPPLIPQEAVLLLNVRQQLPQLRPTESSGDDEKRSTWNFLLDGMEQGRLPGDSNWIVSPVFAASPCMAWYEEEVGFTFDDKPKHVSLELRTFRLNSEVTQPEDLGVSSWDFRVSDDGQLLPVLADLRRLYPLKRKWSCWCPADAVLDIQGMQALGVTESDVLGFQWEFQSVDVTVSVQ